MNQQAFEAGKAAYRRGDVNGAIEALQQAKLPGEVSGSVDHLLGNCLMKLGRYDEAAAAYGDALRDPSYGNTGALACNRGRALLAAGQPQEAIASLIMASKDTSYPTPYKVQVALGNAYLKVGDARDAGVAFRNAAIDETNPDPSHALRSLGSCFMQMGRSVDAVEAYRTALDFSTPQADQNAIYADLGLAYVSANRMTEAVDAFNHATADGTYTLSVEANIAFESARRAANHIRGGSPSETDQFLAAAGYGSGVDPLDPLGESGKFIPSPEDTGFFSVNEKDLVERDKNVRRAQRGGNGCLKFFLVLLLIITVIAGIFAYGYYSGFGWPTQESVVEKLFKTSGEDDSVFVESMNDGLKDDIINALPENPGPLKVTGVDRSMSSTVVYCVAELSSGGEQSYEVQLVRVGLGWKVRSLKTDYPSQDGKVPELDTGSSSSTDIATDANAVTDATTTATGSNGKSNASTTATTNTGANAAQPGGDQSTSDNDSTSTTNDNGSYEEGTVED